MVITPDQYNSTPVYDLLAAAANGLVAVDQRLLKSIVDRGEAAMDDIVRFGVEDRSGDRIELEEDLVALCQHIGSPKGVELLVEYLRREPTDPPEDLIHAFLRVGDAAITPLLALYEELGPEEGGDVAFILSAYRTRDPRILEMLESRLEHDPQDAVFLMGVHADPAANPILELIASKSGEEPSIQQEAKDALEAIASPGVADAPEQVSLWDLYPERLEPVFEVMDLEEKLEFLRCPNAELRADAASSFADREVPAKAKKILMDLARNDENLGVRAVSCEALSSLADEKDVRTLLLEVLVGDRSMPERCGALLALAPKAKELPEVKKRILEFYDNEGVKARAMEAMWRSMDRDFALHFRRHLDDADIDIRRQAIKGVGYLEMSQEAPRLAELFRDEEFRLDALFSYALCVPVKRLQRGDVTEMLQKIDTLAGGLSDAEGEVVQTALDTRLVLHGLEPVFLLMDGEDGGE